MPAGTITTYRPNSDDARGYSVIPPAGRGPDPFFTRTRAEGALEACWRTLPNFRRPDPADCKPFDRLPRGQRATFATSEDALQAGRPCATHVRPIAV